MTHNKFVHLLQNAKAHCPCKGCEERHACCWSNCEGYAEWKAKRDCIKEEYNKENAVSVARNAAYRSSCANLKSAPTYSAKQRQKRKDRIAEQQEEFYKECEKTWKTTSAR